MVMASELKDSIQRFMADVRPAVWARRRRLRNRDFAIVSNDCWGAEVYKDLGLPYATPLIGTFVVAPCFVQLARNPKRLLQSDLRFTPRSKYAYYDAKRAAERPYPIGVLGDAVEIHFLHYASDEEARTKWYRRLERTNLDRLFFKFSLDNDPFPCSEELRTFAALPIRKVIFSKENHRVDGVVRIPSYVVDGKSMYLRSLPHFDVVRWLNDG